MSDPIIIDDDPEYYRPKTMKHLEKFNKWVKRHKLMPGQIIPKRIFKKYFKKAEGK